MESSCDVFILGAGLAGGTLALQLIQANPNLKIVIADKKDFPLEPGSGSVGESTVEVASHYLAVILDLKEHIIESHLPKLGLRYFLETKAESIVNRLEIGTNKYSETPSYQLDRAVLEDHIWNLLDSKKVKRYSNTEIIDYCFDGNRYLINLNDRDGCQIKIGSEWFIDSSGRHSYLKKKLNLKIKSDHECSAAWWKIKAEHRIDNWSDDIEWLSRNGKDNARWYSTNHLMGEGYWFWVIPLSTNQTSFGIVIDSNVHNFSEINTFEKSISWLEKREPQAAKLIIEHRLGHKDFGCLKNYSCEMQEVFSREKWAVTGESGVFIDPFYSPGSDYIAISNTYITDLISRSHRGEDVRLRTEIYNKIYLKLSIALKTTFKNQYAIMGNPLVMPIKVFWDWCFYWNFIARLYFDEKYTDLQYLSKMKDVIEKAELLNDEIQGFLNKWNREERPQTDSGFLDLANYPYLYELNSALSVEFEADVKEMNIEKRFENGICNLELIANEIKNLPSLPIVKIEEVDTEPASNIRRFYQELKGFSCVSH